MKYFKYLACFFLASLVFSCKQYEPLMFSDKPSFEFADTINSAPMGFIVNGASFKKDLRIYLLGSIPDKDIIVKFEYSGSAVRDVNYKVPSEITFPKGATEVILPCEILYTNDTKDLDLRIKIMETEENVTGVKPNSRFKIEFGMPTQWVGYDGAHAYPFDNDFTKCTKAKYQFFYSQFGFFDFSTIKGYSDIMGIFRTKLQSYKFAANQLIVAENALRAEAGKGPLLDDDGSELKF